MKTKTTTLNTRPARKHVAKTGKPKRNDFSVVNRNIRTTFEHALSAFNYFKAVGGRVEVYGPNGWQPV